MSGSSAVVAESLTLARGDNAVLVDADLRVPKASLVAVIGPNGSGKSTLLDAIAGLLHPAAGDLSVLGGRARDASVAYVFQSTATPQNVPLTVSEVVVMGLYRRRGLLGRIGIEGRRSVARAMERVGVEDLARRQIHELSGGQRQRVLVAQGLAADAELLILDEPMTGLDVASREQILQIMNEEQNCGRTVIFSTHDMAEARLADVVVLLAGRIVAVGAPDSVLTDTNLRSAYMGRIFDQDGSAALVDDPHHHH